MVAFLGILEDSFSSWVLSMAAGLIDHSIGIDQINDVATVVTLGGHHGGRNYDAFWSVVNTFLDIVKPFGLALMTTYFLMFLFDAAAKDNITVDGLIKVFIQLIIVVALIGNFDSIINAILSASETLLSNAIDSMTDPSGTSTLTGEDIVNAWNDNDGDICVTILFQSLLFWVIHQIAIVAIYFAVFQRMMDLGWRIIFGPIGIANNFEGGANSAGIRYLKGIAASALGGVAIFAVACAGFSVSAAMLSEVTAESSQTTLLGAQAAFLATAGACIGINTKIRDVVS